MISRRGREVETSLVQENFTVYCQGIDLPFFFPVSKRGHWISSPLMVRFSHKYFTPSLTFFFRSRSIPSQRFYPSYPHCLPAFSLAPVTYNELLSRSRLPLTPLGSACTLHPTCCTLINKAGYFSVHVNYPSFDGWLPLCRRTVYLLSFSPSVL